MNEKNYEEEIEESILYNHDTNSALHRRHRKGDRMHKRNKYVNCISNSTCEYRHKLSRKGVCRNKKVKGETMPSLFVGNTKNEKDWRNSTGRRMTPVKAVVWYSMT